MTGNGRSTEEGDFQITREERRRQRRKELHEKCVYGKREGTGLKSGPKYSDVFVFRIHSDVTNDELQEFVTNKGVVVNELKQVSKDGSKMKSFKLTVQTCLMSEDFWPDGIGCRDYVEYRRFTGGKLGK